MIEVAIIAPSAEILNFGRGRYYHLLLAHMAEDSTYVVNANELKGYKILDNSLMERGHKAMDVDALILAALVLEPDEIVLPDVFRDGEQTLEIAKVALERITHQGYRKRYQVAAVCHGTTPEEWLYCYRGLQALGVDCIHIPKVMDELWPYGGRAGLIHWLDADHKVRAQYLEHHLLGIWTSPAELLTYARIPWIRGLDTALPIQAALQGVVFHPKWGLNTGNKKPKRPVDYFDLTLNHTERVRANENVRILDNLAKGVI